MIPRWLFDERKTVLINLPFSNKMNTFQKSFVRSFIQMQNSNLTSFGQREKLSHYLKLNISLNILVVLYIKEFVVCGHNYIGETIRNALTRIDEHEQKNDKSEPSKYLKNNPGHKFDWMILSRAPSHRLKQKILEADFIKQLNSSLNDQLDSEILILFKHGVT